uniref:Uncharacterized protein n=1 Tax=Oryza meridionalis TaxID=40149 RepID=A0A0E0CU77_9ORYZ
MERSEKPCARLLSGTMRATRRRSCFVKASAAASLEETTTTVVRPSLSAMTGPWTRARLVSRWWRTPWRLSTAPGIII